MINKTLIWVCDENQLKEGGYKQLDVAYLNETSSVVVFRYRSEFKAYLNRCVHMPRRLDCEKDMIFDQTGQYLRCSMHGIVHDPISGESLSEICRGQKLTSVKLLKNQEGVWICDKRVFPLAQ